MTAQVKTPEVGTFDSHPQDTTPSINLARIVIMLLAAATIVPASVYLDYAETRPSFASFVLVASGSFVLLSTVVGPVYARTRSELVVVIIALVWIVLTTFGQIVVEDISEFFRFLILLTLLCLVALMLRMFRERIVVWFVIASVMSVVATAVQLAMVLSAPEPDFEPLAVDLVPIAPAGNFYLIVVDGYGPLSGDTTDESSFLDTLEDAGLGVVPDAVANYSFTYSSISNMLSLSHEFRSDVSRSVEIFASMQGQNQMRSVFEEAGWNYVHIESDWTGSRCGSTVVNCLENGWVDDFVWEFARRTYIGSHVERSFPHPHISQGFRSLDTIKTHIQESSGLDFVFAHILLPHPPLQLLPNCDIQIDPRFLGQMYLLPGIAEPSPVELAQAYRDQRVCLDLKLTKLIAALPANASVVITSDHGPDLGGQLQKAPQIWTDADIEQRLRIFHAARLPEGCEPSHEHDLVNLIRSEVACVTGASLPPVEPYFEISPFLWSEDRARVLTREDLSVWLDDD